MLHLRVAVCGCYVLHRCARCWWGSPFTVEVWGCQGVQHSAWWLKCGGTTRVLHTLWCVHEPIKLVVLFWSISLWKKHERTTAMLGGHVHHLSLHQAWLAWLYKYDNYRTSGNAGLNNLVCGRFKMPKLKQIKKERKKAKCNTHCFMYYLFMYAFTVYLL